MSTALPGARTVAVGIDAMGQVGSLTPPGRAAHAMGYDGEGRMTSFTSPAPVVGGAPLTLGRAYANGRRRHTRADGAFVDLAYDDTVTGQLNTVTFPSLGAVSYGYLPQTGAGDRVSDPSGCRLRTAYAGHPLATGVALEKDDGRTGAV